MGCRRVLGGQLGRVPVLRSRIPEVFCLDAWEELAHAERFRFSKSGKHRKAAVHSGD